MYFASYVPEPAVRISRMLASDCQEAVFRTFRFRRAPIIAQAIPAKNKVVRA